MNSFDAVSKINKFRKTRFIELDIFRGFAIIGMVLLHILWDLDYFGILPLNRDIYQFQFAIPTLFFILVGICLSLTSNKLDNYKKMIRRGLWVFSLGLLITMVTFTFLPEKPILFGVLHCIGFSIMLSIPFLRFKHLNFIFASIIIVAGIIVNNYFISNPTVFHLVLGIHQADLWRHTIDYFPILPWFGVCLLGIAFGKILYDENGRKFRVPEIINHKPAKAFSWLGKHSLAIYLLHQPVIAGIISIYTLF